MNQNKKAQQHQLSENTKQLLQSFNRQLQENVTDMQVNFSNIIKDSEIKSHSKISASSAHHIDNYQMTVRAANIVRAGESLMKLISELKTLLILNDFPQVNKHVKDRNTECERISNIIMEKMVRIGEEGNMTSHNLLSVLDATK